MRPAGVERRVGGARLLSHSQTVHVGTKGYAEIVPMEFPRISPRSSLGPGRGPGGQVSNDARGAGPVAGVVEGWTLLANLVQLSGNAVRGPVLLVFGLG